MEGIGQLEIELRLLKILLGEDRELRGYILKKVPPDAIINLRDAWNVTVEKLTSNESINTDILRLNTRIDAVQRGLVESLDNVPAYTDESSLNDLIESILVGHNRQRLLSSIRPHIKNVSEGSVQPKEALGGLMTAIQELTIEFSGGDNETGIGEGYETDKIVRTIFSKQNTLTPLGFRGFDDACGGLSMGDLVIINVPTNCGKTTFMLQAAQNIADRGFPTAFYSLELSESEIWKRVAANRADVPLKTLRNPDEWNGDLEKRATETITQWAEHLRSKNSKFIVKDDPMVTITAMTSDIASRGYKVIFIDYLGLLAEGDGERWERLGELARRLKLLARSFDIAVVVAVQKDEDTGKIRYSREIKEHADIVLGWTIEDKEEGMSDSYFQIEVEKGRNIQRFKFPMYAQFDRMRIQDSDAVSSLGNVAARNQSSGGRSNSPRPQSNVAIPNEERPKVHQTGMKAHRIQL